MPGKSMVIHRGSAKRGRSSAVLTREDVRKIVQRQAELKQYTGSTGSSVDVLAGFQDELTRHIQKGDSSTHRDGDKIKLKRISLNLRVSNQFATPLLYRVMLVRTKNPDLMAQGAVWSDPAFPANVFEPSGDGSSGAFTVLYDKFGGLEGDGISGEQRTHQISLPQDTYVHFRTENSTHAKGGIWLLLLSNAVGASEVFMDYGFTIQYTDV